MRLPSLLVLATLALALSPAVLAEPASSPTDPRLAPPKDLDGYFPFTPPRNLEEWKPRADEVRMRIRVSQGLWPEPPRTPLKANIYGRIEQEDYTVEKVTFESMPGFYVTGSLFRPKGKPGPHPAVLCPHGHWPDGRLGILSDEVLKRELESGQEYLPNGGRSIFQSLGVQLARMGCVALVYDMIGYADSQQISFETVHKFAKQEPELNAKDGWRFFSPRAEANLQSVMGLQTWNSIRAIDFMQSLPDVDPKRIGMTGGSGGGTQTFIAGAIDPRVTVAVPAVMVSTAMQGGCTCENACLLRIGTGNVEFAALFAPKPMGMTAAKDWTEEMITKGYPELQKHWALHGKPENVKLWSMLQFPHNYNAPSREKIYAWFNEHFGLGHTQPIKEREYPLLTREQMSVWDEAHPAPPSGPEVEKALLRWWDEQTGAKLNASPEAFQEIASKGWGTIIGRAVPDASDFKAAIENASDASSQQIGLQHSGTAETVSVFLQKPKGTVRGIVLWLSAKGGNDREAAPDKIAELLDAGLAVATPSLIGQGGQLVEKNQRVKNPRESAAYTYGYNHP
ncbi:MAG: acetylxylan esterase, partial [Chthoniobacteraceae bacterium]